MVPFKLPTLLALLFVGLILTWVALPGTVSMVNYVLLASLLVALAAVAKLTYANAQATGSPSGLIHATATAAATAPGTGRFDAPTRAGRQ